MLVQGSARKRTLGAPSPSRAPLLLRAVPHGDSDTTTDSPPFLKPGLPSPPSSPRRASPRVPFGRSAEGRSVVGLPGGAGSSLHPRPHCACAQPWLPGRARKLVSGVSSALAPPPSPPPTAPLCPPVRQYLERPVFPSHTMGVTSGPSLGALSTFCCRDPSVFPPANPYSSLQSRLFPEAL